MSSALEQRFPDSVFLRNTKGERARFKKANLGNRNWAGWVHLQSYGKAPAVLVSDLKVGDYILYNYGYKSQVKSITPKGKASVVVETESAKDGKLYDRTYRLKSLIPILSDRQIQIHQRLKSKGYGAEEEKENETVVITLTMNDDWATVENAKEIIQEMVEESGYGGNFGEYYELIVEFETENEKFLGAVEHYISDENLPYEIEGFFANYDYPIGGYAESFGAETNKETVKKIAKKILKEEYSGLNPQMVKIKSVNQNKDSIEYTISFRHDTRNKSLSGQLNQDGTTYDYKNRQARDISMQTKEAAWKITHPYDYLYIKVKRNQKDAQQEAKNRKLINDIIYECQDYFIEQFKAKGVSGGIPVREYFKRSTTRFDYGGMKREGKLFGYNRLEVLAPSFTTNSYHESEDNRNFSEPDSQTRQRIKKIEKTLQEKFSDVEITIRGETTEDRFQNGEVNVLFIVKLKDKGYAAETFGAEAGTYRINWKDGKRGVTFDYEGGDDMHFDDTWTDLFWDASNPQVTEAPARKKRGLFRGKRGAESFNAVVIAPEQPKGSVEKALMNHYLFQESVMRQALMEIENRVDLGLMTAEEAERKLNRLIQQKMRSENYASENTGNKLLSGVFMLVAVASLWRAVTVTEDTYLFPKENKYMTILGSASIGLGILAWKGDSILAALED